MYEYQYVALVQQDSYFSSTFCAYAILHFFWFWNKPKICVLFVHYSHICETKKPIFCKHRFKILENILYEKRWQFHLLHPKSYEPLSFIKTKSTILLIFCVEDPITIRFTQNLYISLSLSLCLPPPPPSPPRTTVRSGPASHLTSLNGVRLSGGLKWAICKDMYWENAFPLVFTSPPPPPSPPDQWQMPLTLCIYPVRKHCLHDNRYFMVSENYDNRTEET